ncbi:MAG: GAF domain-containing protein [Fidelibacterota bacterium]
MKKNDLKDGKWLDDILSSELTLPDKLRRICDTLAAGKPHYDWVGFYLADNATETLRLGPYRGAPTKHVRIQFGRGVCGRAALSGKTLLIQDVNQETNYLACSIAVQSEIVVPILHNGCLTAVLDIDSHKKSAFSTDDRVFLERLSARIAPLFAGDFAETKCRD